MKPLLDVLQNKSPSRRPIWLMRQAGRYLPEYREVRKKAGSFLDLCYSPDLAAEVTLQPLRRFDLDAAILFSDILVVPKAMGLALDFVENEGPKLETVCGIEGVRRLDAKNAADNLGKVYETVSLVRRELSERVGLIGFCGGAWTVASYMIEGGSSDRKRALAVAAGGEAWFGDLVEKVIEVSVDYLCRQVEAGAETLQIFDSWAGDVPAELWETVIFAPSRNIIDGVRARHPDVPMILFARGLGEGHADAARYCAPNAVGVEQGVSLGGLSARLGKGVAVQGNLDPEMLVAGEKEFRSAVEDVLNDAPENRHIFNLGHGILPTVSPERVTELVRLIRGHDGV